MDHRRALRTLPVGLILVVLCIATGTLPASGGTATSDSAWVVVRTPALGSYTPADGDQANTAGGAITVTRSETGQWRILIPGMRTVLSDNATSLQVTAMGTSPAVCQASSLAGSGDQDLFADVGCVSIPSGTPVDSPFVLGFVYQTYEAASNPTFGYAWVYDGKTVDPDDQRDVAGGTITSTNPGPGSITFDLPGIARATYAAVSGFQGTDPCRILGWAGTASTTVSTFCGGSAPADQKRTVYVARKTGPLGFGRAGATAVGSRPATARYRPDRAYRWSSSDRSPTISRIGPGHYTVTFPGQATGGVAFVTAYGAKDRTCQVGSIARRGPSASVGVRCFRFSGAPADAMFTIGWAGESVS